MVRLVFSGLGLWCLFPIAWAGAAAPDPEAAKVARGVRESRERLLRLPGGLTFRFRVDSEQRRERPYFYFADGVDGVFAVKWPKCRNLIKGVMHGIIEIDAEGNPQKVARMTEMEGGYDFESQTSVSREGKELGQIIGMRTHPSSSYAFPLTAQYFVQFCREYFPGEEMRTDLWLPNALEQYPYQVAGEEEIEGIRCRVLKRGDVDSLWIAEKQGHVVCRRELRWGAGKPLRERMWSRQLKQIAPGVWMPMEVVQDVFDRDNADHRLIRYLIKVRDVEVGKVAEGQLKVVFPADIRHVEDYVTGTMSDLSGAGQDEETRLLESVKSARYVDRGDVPKNPWNLPLILANTIVVLGIVMFVVFRRTA